MVGQTKIHIIDFQRACLGVKYGTLNIFLILGNITDKSQNKDLSIDVFQTGGAAIKKWPKSKIIKILVNKNLLLPLTSASEIFLGCTTLKF